MQNAKWCEGMEKGKRVATRRTGWQARMIAFHRHWEVSNTLACNSSGISSTLWQPLVLITISYELRVQTDRVWEGFSVQTGRVWEEISACAYFNSILATCQNWQPVSQCLSEDARTGSAIKVGYLIAVAYIPWIYSGRILVAEINRTGSIGRWEQFSFFILW